MSRSLNDIIPPSRRRTMAAEAPPPADYTQTPPPRGHRPRSRFPYGTALMALIVVAISAGILIAFSGAKVEVTPNANSAQITSDFDATAGGGTLQFEVISIDKTASQSVPAEATETKSDPASGTITIYNAQTAPQQLIKNTRFQTTDGLVFRIRDSVSVPAGSANAPGQVQATVYADQPGEQYNIGPADFKLPGLQNSASYDLVYAKSTQPMTGGFSGTRPTVSEATIQSKEGALRESLEKELQGAVAEKLKELGTAAGTEYVFIPGASVVTYEMLPDAPGQGGNVDVKMRGVMQAVVFKNEEIARAIAFAVVGSYSGQPIRLTNPEALTITPKSAESPMGAQAYSFTLSGTANLIWQVDEARIAGAVAGKTRESVEVLLTSFPELDKATAVLRPFWANTFPDNPEKIQVIVREPEKK